MGSGKRESLSAGSSPLHIPTPPPLSDTLGSSNWIQVSHVRVRNTVISAIMYCLPRYELTGSRNGELKTGIWIQSWKSNPGILNNVTNAPPTLSYLNDRTSDKVTVSLEHVLWLFLYGLSSITTWYLLGVRNNTLFIIFLSL